MEEGAAILIGNNCISHVAGLSNTGITEISAFALDWISTQHGDEYNGNKNGDKNTSNVDIDGMILMMPMGRMIGHIVTSFCKNILQCQRVQSCFDGIGGGGGGTN